MDRISTGIRQLLDRVDAQPRRATSDRLAAHGRFLQESFAESSLSLAPPRGPAS